MVHEEPNSLSFAFPPRFNIGTDKSAAQSGATLRHMHSRYFPNSISFICRASNRGALSNILENCTIEKQPLVSHYLLKKHSPYIDRLSQLNKNMVDTYF